jgi:hypothetical protein
LNVISGIVSDAETKGTNGFLSMNAPEGGVKDARILADRTKHCQTPITTSCEPVRHASLGDKEEDQ